ncbi:hypothetical protein GPECTOR_27g720 [Gonium pectorale]|uniref:Uncharacterized protein n=1 Tax=Gonium pectorale TaxID=33097 RepID=A0A150GFB4_GONPE|nr:hypothetical protein GPECTOR_27g720 [Gonium pectorale]|eukprot:KXZ48549.1 hypothetical protein GPECTOR_27g720 [Gonium pectorale]
MTGSEEGRSSGGGGRTVESSSVSYNYKGAGIAVPIALPGKWRAPWGLLALSGALILIAGFGSGFGAGWAAHPARTAAHLADDAGNDPQPTNEDTLRPWVPLDFTANLPNDRVAVHYEQAAVLAPGLAALSVALTALSGSAHTHDPAVLRSFVLARYRGSQDTLARLYTVAQRLQCAE